MLDTILNIKNLTITVPEGGQTKVITDDVNLTIAKESIVALVGGSGSGKTTTGLAILKLLSAGLTVKTGEIIYKGTNLVRCSEEQIQRIRGGSISMVFQEPLTAFNPVFSLGYQVDEVMSIHTELSAKQRQDRMEELFDLVGLPDPKRIVKSYPHQLSGGMRQRAMIAQAIAANPQLIVADEPTSSLDVTLQAKIIDLFRKLRSELKLSILLITHDLGMVQHLADDVAVMHHGKVVESGKTEEVLQSPKDEYTHELMKAL